MPHPPFRIPVIVVVALVTCQSAPAQSVYKWLDAEGHVHYGESKPDNVPEASPIPILRNTAPAQEIYKWRDAKGHVHYSQYQPDDPIASEVIPVPPQPDPAITTQAERSETDRLNALTDEIVNKRRAAQQDHAQQTIRALQQENEALQQQLLTEQLGRLKQKPGVSASTSAVPSNTIPKAPNNR